MTTPTLAVTKRGPAVWLELNRPACRNAINNQVLNELEDALDALDRADAASVLVFAGRGPSFCSGADLRYLLRLSTGERPPTPFLSRLSELFTRVERLGIPTIAVLHGHAVAGGLELALACDVVIAASGTLVGDGHVARNLLPGGGASVRLSRAVGPSTARWLALSGALVDAERLRATGWVFDIVPAETLAERAQELAWILAGNAGQAQRSYKTLLRESRQDSDDEALEAELQRFDEHWRLQDPSQTLRAFVGYADARDAHA